ncbi:fructose-1,6-bisphosphate aldolase [Neokomagataea tanensis NBRC 106556]|uniref:fructose-bisphosphate aldolase n=2 Tax=Acetobacteraceae TaxID=433 RepID=A0ABQ0QI45_9PROT|nr:fructose-1,6-bisphosphate aldolase [Neokomagataea tanensis NBRC 106556]
MQNDRQEMARRIQRDPGYLAALDQSGGSTPSALATYGVLPDAYKTEEAMFDAIHAMRCRIMTAPAFSGQQVLGAILFDRTLGGEVKGVSVPSFLWQKRRIVPFVKIDQGLMAEAQGVQMMRPLRDVGTLLARASALGVYGTKARSVIHRADKAGIVAVVEQQIRYAECVIEAGLTPILEPEVSVKSSEKSEAEHILRDVLLDYVEKLPESNRIILKLTLPEIPNHYDDLNNDPRILRIVALSGGYSLTDACNRLARNNGMIASFSRALLDRLRIYQDDAEFNAVLKQVSDSIYDASVNKILG